MKRRSIIWYLTSAIAVGLLALPAWAADSLSGTWVGQITDPLSGPHPIVLRLEVSGDKITGSLKGGPPRGEEQPIEDAQLRGDQLSFKVAAKGPDGEPVTLVYKGKVTGNHIAGTNEGPRMGPGGNVPWEVTKK